MIRFIATALLAIAAIAPAHAGSQVGKIKTLTIRASDGLVYFVLEGQRNERPACASGDYWMIRAEDSTTGKRQLAVLLTARASGQPVTVIGFNACTRWADGEDVNELYL
ncbi:hypothetical protein ACFJIX_12470 [Roseateles sp. UC29_93]|uniref:hypothetical protein n=1 Tax=Roseateles sp. UC29_93 TaxID=3350177 RepID=UPI00031109C3